ncbi:hypothetical protein [Actinoplanes sp. NPDC048796]|uniref:hypothetical protein n=1 Tax=Actinoplanes sp. NPDC048796 TaxID=3155640 RepID=UPI0033E30C36
MRELTGASELELAQVICRVARTRALLDYSSVAARLWCLVTADGSHGQVQTDAFEPIPGEPDLPVVSPPGWAQH